MAEDDREDDQEAHGADRIPPWTIKRVPAEMRKEITFAAKRAGQPVGDWLVETARARIAAERAPAGEVIPPGVPEPTGSDPRASLTVVTQIAPLLPAMAGEGGSKRVLGTARKVLEQHLRALALDGQTGRQPRLTGPSDPG